MPVYTAYNAEAGARLYANGELREVPVRYYEAADVRGEFAPAGYYLDWQSDEARAMVHDLRTSGARPAHRDIAVTYGFQHWLHSYRAGDAESRRRQRELARGSNPHAGRRDHRTYARRNMRTSPAAPGRSGSRPNTSLSSGRFGIEIEFNTAAEADYGHGHTVRTEAVRLMRAEGITAQIESYNHTTQAHWKMTTDATVTGGECVSPIMAGDTASLDEVRDVIRAIKDAGGVTGRNVGMHVHHDCTDFTTASDRQRLMDVLRHAEHALAAYVYQPRLDGSVGCSARTMRPGEWDTLRRNVANIVPGSNARGYHDSGEVDRYRFVNVEGPLRKYGTVEFRGLGNTLHAGKVRVWVRVGQATVEFARNGHSLDRDLTPAELMAKLREHNLIGARTADKFLSECERRSA